MGTIRANGKWQICLKWSDYGMFLEWSTVHLCIVNPILTEIDNNTEQIKWLLEVQDINIMDYMTFMDDLLATRTRLFVLLEDE